MDHYDGYNPAKDKYRDADTDFDPYDGMKPGMFPSWAAVAKFFAFVFLFWVIVAWILVAKYW